MTDNLTTETIEVDEITIGKTKTGKPLFNMSAPDGRVWGTTRDDLIEEGRRLKQQGAKIVVVDYTESQNRQYTNRYIEAVRLANGEECRDLLAKKEDAAA